MSRRGAISGRQGRRNQTEPPAFWGGFSRETCRHRFLSVNISDLLMILYLIIMQLYFLTDIFPSVPLFLLGGRLSCFAMIDWPHPLLLNSEMAFSRQQCGVGGGRADHGSQPAHSHHNRLSRHSHQIMTIIINHFGRRSKGVRGNANQSFVNFEPGKILILKTDYPFPTEPCAYLIFRQKQRDHRPGPKLISTSISTFPPSPVHIIHQQSTL